MTIESNLTGLRYALESSLGVLPGSPDWNPLEPNGYNDFGGQLTTVARAPISADRQRKKGSITDIDASAGFTTDITSTNMHDLFRGFMFAAWREKKNDNPSAVSATVYTVPTGTDYTTHDLVFGEQFAIAGNNGLKKVTAVAATTVSAAGLATEAPSSAAKIRIVGVEGASGDLSISTAGADPVVTSAATIDFTTYGLIPGEWVYVGGDAANSTFATAGNNGFARIKAITAGSLTFDKTQGTMATDTGAGKSVRIFFGDAIKNESNPSLIVRQSFQFERSLSTAGYEYIEGCVPNTMNLTIATADKMTAEVAFVGTDATAVDAGSRKAGNFPSLVGEDQAYNTTSDFSRLRLADTGGTGVETFVTEVQLNISNNATPTKAVANLGAIEVNAGDFSVSGQITAYFTDVATINAVRSNADVTLDFVAVVNNAGTLVDVPLLGLGDGRLNIEKDQPVTIPLSMDAAADPTLNHTLLIMEFAYLPSIAE